MSETPRQVLLIDTDDAVQAQLEAAGWSCTRASDDATLGQVQAVVWALSDAEAARAAVQRASFTQRAFDHALLVLADVPAADEALLLQRGAEAVLGSAERAGLARALDHALCRKQVERAARTAYATDLATGLPHQAQLIEHLSHLLALREREPAPMVLMVLRIEGVAAVAARLSEESANVLRRKVAVRLRSGLRSSDVVAALSPDTFAVLLGRLQSRNDGPAVASKLVRLLEQPIPVSGQACSVKAHVGLALYPDQGKDAKALLQRALGQAAQVAPMGREGVATALDGRSGNAANDAP